MRANVVLTGEWVIAVCRKRSRSDSGKLKRETWKTIIIKLGQANQVIIVFKLRAKEIEDYHA